MWRAFGRRVNQAASALDEKTVVDAARFTFAQMQACLTR
jgi:heme oxygenase